MRTLPQRLPPVESRILALLFGLASCGEPIEPPGAAPIESNRTLPVVASRRVDTVGEAFRVSIEMTRASRKDAERIAYVDRITDVVDGRRTKWDRHAQDGGMTAMTAGSNARLDFSLFEQLLPRRDGDVPEAWQADGVFGTLRHSTGLPEMPAAIAGSNRFRSGTAGRAPLSSSSSGRSPKRGRSCSRGGSSTISRRSCSFWPNWTERLPVTRFRFARPAR
jgi:hypothetical protein